MKIFFSHDKFNVTLCLEYTSTYLFSPSTPPPSPPYLDPIKFHLDPYKQLITMNRVH